jgi:hypothetical protein
MGAAHVPVATVISGCNIADLVAVLAGVALFFSCAGNASAATTITIAVKVFGFKIPSILPKRITPVLHAQSDTVGQITNLAALPEISATLPRPSRNPGVSPGPSRRVDGDKGGVTRREASLRHGKTGKKEKAERLHQGSIIYGEPSGVTGFSA